MIRIGLAQTDSSEDFAQNLENALGHVEEAAQAGVQLLTFPEVFLFRGRGIEGKVANALTLGDATVQQFQAKARQHGMAILMGSVHERIPGRDDKVHNTSIFIDETGEVRGVYRKLKLFNLDTPQLKALESNQIVPGDQSPPVVDTTFGKLGLTICFDLRYPELYQHLRRNGAQVVFIPSNFTFPTGAAHWDLLLRARAVENQVFVAAPAQTGQGGGKSRSWGHSMLVDPWGTVTAAAGDATGLTVGQIDLATVERVRTELPMGVVEA